MSLFNIIDQICKTYSSYPLYSANQDEKTTSNISSFSTNPLVCTIYLLLTIYFCGDYSCQIIGFLYPCYRIYQFIDGTENNNKSALQYIVLYGHMEMISLLLLLFNINLYYLRLALVIILLYTWINNETKLDSWYRKTIIFDHRLYRLLRGIWKKLVDEYYKSHQDSTKKQ